MTKTIIQMLEEACESQDWGKVRMAYRMLGGKDMNPRSVVINYDWRLSENKGVGKTREIDEKPN
tara:strand:- start:34574 stop:34765 length:192 start_codon:yes stop_codon:yes gene_type:complete